MSSSELDIAHLLETNFFVLSQLINATSELLLNLPESLAGSVSANAAARVVEHRTRVASISDVISRRHLKVVFFGRTSSGKSSAINALLGDSVLPTGLGHTTACFVQVKGTASNEPTLVLPNENEEEDRLEISIKSLPELVHALSDKRLCASSTLELLWPRERCKLLQQDDVILVDSPGVDVEADFDEWIDVHCLDADLFVLVVNAESTLMMREKAFFRQVSAKIAKPNILVLLNRWDCAAQEEEYFIHAAQDQHLTRTTEFLVDDLKVAACAEEASRQIFFVSANEILGKNVNASKGPLMQQRTLEWARFEAYIRACLETAAQGARYGPHVDAGEAIVEELESFLLSVLETWSEKLDKVEKETLDLETTLADIHVGMELLTREFKAEIKVLLEDVERIVADECQYEVENLHQHVCDFQATFYNDPVVIAVYKQQLARHVEDSVLSSLKSRINRQINHVVETAQASMLERIGCLLPEERRAFVDIGKVGCISYDLNSMVNCLAALTDFKEDVDFSFSLSPQQLMVHARGLQSKCFSGWSNSDNSSGTSTIVVQKDDSQRLNWTLAKIVAASVLTTETSAGIAAVKSVGHNKTTVRFALSLAMIYTALYVCERAAWTLHAKERQLKRQFVAHAGSTFKDIVPHLKSGVRSQVQRELTTLLGLACGAVESAGVDLKEHKEKIADEAESLASTVENCNHVLDSLQDVRYEFARATNCQAAKLNNV